MVPGRGTLPGVSASFASIFTALPTYFHRTNEEPTPGTHGTITHPRPKTRSRTSSVFEAKIVSDGHLGIDTIIFPNDVPLIPTFDLPLTESTSLARLPSPSTVSSLEIGCHMQTKKGSSNLCPTTPSSNNPSSKSGPPPTASPHGKHVASAMATTSKESPEVIVYDGAPEDASCTACISSVITGLGIETVGWHLPPKSQPHKKRDRTVPEGLIAATGLLSGGVIRGHLQEYSLVTSSTLVVKYTTGLEARVSLIETAKEIIKTCCGSNNFIIEIVPLRATPIPAVRRRNESQIAGHRIEQDSGGDGHAEEQHGRTKNNSAVSFGAQKTLLALAACGTMFAIVL